MTRRTLTRFLSSLIFIAILTGLIFPSITSAQTKPVDTKIKFAMIRSMANVAQFEWRRIWGFTTRISDDKYVGGLLDTNLFLRNRRLDEDALVAEMKKFHVIIIEDLGGDAAVIGVRQLTGPIAKRAPIVGRALARYVSEGGGLFLMPQTSRYAADDSEEIVNLLLKPLGMTSLQEGVYDAKHIFTSDPSTLFPPREYLFTDNIKPHAVTKGIKRLYLPAFFRNKKRGQPGVQAVKYSKDWTVVAAGHKTAKSYKKKRSNAMMFDKVGRYKTTPPIAAVRTLGKGRIFSLAALTPNLFLNYSSKTWQKISEEVGDRKSGTPSDTMKLALNAIDWLAVPSQKIDGFGTFVAPPYEKITYKGKKRQIGSWRFPAALARDQDVRGIVGVHTAYSDGQGSVRDYVKACKEAGLKFIVFTESLEHLTASELDKLKKDCKAVSNKDFYACPGVEFIDPLGVRWIAWAERLIYPPKTLKDNNRTYPYFDGKVLHRRGAYSMAHHFPPLGRLGTKTFKKEGGHPANLWWFHRFMPFVYDVDKRSELDIDGYLYGLRDVRHLALSSFTRVRKPADVAKAAAACSTVFNSVAAAKSWCNTKGPIRQNNAHPLYVTEGPRISQWTAFSAPGRGLPVEKIRGEQRVRAKFTVTSEAGIDEVKVHDANFGPIRIFKGNGKKKLSQIFEVVYDRQHYLTLEVTDVNGKRAVSSPYVVQGVYRSMRCGDNLNFLGSDTIITHPHNHQSLQLAHPMMGRLKLENEIRGIDGGGTVAPSPNLFNMEYIRTTSANRPDRYGGKEGMAGKVLDVPMSSNNINIYSMTMNTVAEMFSNDKHPGAQQGPVLRHLKPREFVEHTSSSYVMKPRISWDLCWNKRRHYEGTQEYKAGLIWHTGRIRIKKDVEVRAGIQLMMLVINGRGGVDLGMSHNLFVKDAERGPLNWTLTSEGKNPKPHDVKGTLAAGGYAGVMPSPVGYYAFLFVGLCTSRNGFGFFFRSRASWTRVSFIFLLLATKTLPTHI